MIFGDALQAINDFVRSGELAKYTSPPRITDSSLKMPTFSCCIVQIFFVSFIVKSFSSIKPRFKLKEDLLSLWKYTKHNLLFIKISVGSSGPNAFSPFCKTNSLSLFIFLSNFEMVTAYFISYNFVKAHL